MATVRGLDNESLVASVSSGTIFSKGLKFYLFLIRAVTETLQERNGSSLYQTLEDMEIHGKMLLVIHEANRR